MRIHRVNGKSLRDALERARSLHGENALVLSHETTAQGVTVAVTEPARKVAFPAANGGEPSDHVMIERQDPGRADVVRRLSKSGASETFVKSVMDELDSTGARGIGAIDAAAIALERLVPIAASPKIGGTPVVIAFVGPTGVGKTTTLAKLAARLVRAGRRVSLTTTDTHRAGGVEHLGAHAKLLQAPFHVAKDADELLRAIESSSNVDAILIDTAGHSPRDGELLERSAETLAKAGRGSQLSRYLVVSAGASRAALELARQTFASLDPTALVITKLDETREPAAALELGAQAQLGLAFLCDGQDVARDLHRPNAKHVVDLFLRGRIA